MHTANVSFQIEDTVLADALDRLQDILDDLDANAVVDSEVESTEPSLRELLRLIQGSDAGPRSEED